MLLKVPSAFRLGRRWRKAYPAGDLQAVFSSRYPRFLHHVAVIASAVHGELGGSDPAGILAIHPDSRAACLPPSRKRWLRASDSTLTNDLLPEPTSMARVSGRITGLADGQRTRHPGLSPARLKGVTQVESFCPSIWICAPAGVEVTLSCPGTIVGATGLGLAFFVVVFAAAPTGGGTTVTGSGAPARSIWLQLRHLVALARGRARSRSWRRCGRTSSSHFRVDMPRKSRPQITVMTSIAGNRNHKSRQA